MFIHPLLSCFLQDDATEIAEKIFLILQSPESTYSVDRCRIVGGFGKKTSTAVKVSCSLPPILSVVVRGSAHCALTIIGKN
jgi:hypothetical protein